MRLHLRSVRLNAANNHFTLETKDMQGHSVVVLHVFEGLDKPYFYKGKVYKRHDTADREVDRTELKRLIREGQNLSFEEEPARDQEISFDVLSRSLTERANLKNVDEDVLKTLRLYSSKGVFNNAAAILGDVNSFPGVDIVRFGDGISEILDRERFIGVSALSQLEGALGFYRRYYQYERIEGISQIGRAHV